MTVKLKSMYKAYYQKSKQFMYPVLGIKRGFSVTPIQTYACWEGHYTKDDAKLCTLYHLRDDQEFKLFEAQKLLGNRLYHDFRQVKDEMGVYVFDFTETQKDWDNFIAGQYSKLSEAHKRKILLWCGKNNPNYGYMESYLYPERYYSMYVDLVGEKLETLKQVGQLTSKPDLVQENLNESVINLDIVKKLT